MRKALSAAIALSLVGAFGQPVAAQADDDQAQVTIVHGIPGQTVDVYADDAPLIAGLVPQTTTKTFDLDADDYTVSLFSAGADFDSDESLVEADVDIEGGTNVTVVAHLDEDGEFTVSTFENDLDDVRAGDACVIARHTAAAPEVDVLIDGDTAITDLAAGEGSNAAFVDPGSIEVNIAEAGDDEGLLDRDVELTLAEGVCTIAYAIGDAEDDSLGVLLQLVGGLDSAPEDTIDTGLSGLLDSDGGLPVGYLLIVAIGLMGGGFATRSLTTSRR